MQQESLPDVQSTRSSVSQVDFSSVKQARSLDVDLIAAGFSPQSEALPSEDSYLASISYSSSADPSLVVQETGEYYIQILPAPIESENGSAVSRVTTSEERLTTQLVDDGWDYAVGGDPNQQQIVGPNGGVGCGDLISLFGYKGGKIRFVSIRYLASSCPAPGEKLDENRTITYRIFVSDILDTQTVVNDVNTVSR